jgi:hypothetical protein
MSTDHIQIERRAGQRFEYHLPIAVRVPGREGEGVGFTQNLSSKGALFQTDFSLREAEAVEFTVVMPSEITLGENMRVRCRGRVLRSAQSGSGSTVAVHFAGYEFLPDEESIPAHRTPIVDAEPFEQQAGLSAHTFSMRPLA